MGFDDLGRNEAPVFASRVLSPISLILDIGRLGFMVVLLVAALGERDKKKKGRKF